MMLLPLHRLGRVAAGLAVCLLAGALLALVACGPGRGGHQRAIVAIDREAARTLGGEWPTDTAFMARLDSLERLGAACPDTLLGQAAVELAWAMLKGKKYAQLTNYVNDVTPPLEGIVVHERPMQEHIIALQIINAELMGELGLMDRFSTLLLSQLPKARKLGLNRTLGAIYNDLGYVYNEQKRYDLAIEYLSLAAKLHENHPTRELLVSNLNNIAYAYKGKGDLEKALEYSMAALHRTPDTDTLLKMRVRNNLSTHYTAMGEYGLALKQVSPAMAWFEQNRMCDELPLAYNRYAYNSWRLGDVAAARQYFDKAFARRGRLAMRHKLTLINQYADFCDSIGDRDKEIELLLYYRALNDSILAGDKGETLSRLYEDEVAKSEENQRMYDDARRAMWARQAAMAVAVLLALGVLVWLSRRQRRLRMALEQSRDDMHEQLVQAMVERERSQNVVSSLRADLERLQKQMGALTQKDTLSAMRRITSQAMQAEEAATPAEAWAIANPAFYNTLLARWPNLTKNDLKLCAMLRKGMSSKEIAEVSCREVHSVEVARNRLRKKMGLPRSEDLSLFLIRLIDEV